MQKLLKAVIRSSAVEKVSRVRREAAKVLFSQVPESKEAKKQVTMEVEMIEQPTAAAVEVEVTEEVKLPEEETEKGKRSSLSKLFCLRHTNGVIEEVPVGTKSSGTFTRLMGRKIAYEKDEKSMEVGDAKPAKKGTLSRLLGRKTAAAVKATADAAGDEKIPKKQSMTMRSFMSGLLGRKTSKRDMHAADVVPALEVVPIVDANDEAAQEVPIAKPTISELF